MIAIGIDPGLTGAIAFVDHRSCVIEDLPTMALPGDGMVRRKIDGRAFAEMLRRHTVPGEPVRVFCEAVHAISGAPGRKQIGGSIQTQASLMRTLGAIEAVLECMRMTPEMVYPQKWKKFYALGSDKSAALTRARELYPALAVTSLRLAKFHNRAEALLIAHWGRQVNA